MTIPNTTDASTADWPRLIEKKLPDSVIAVAQTATIAVIDALRATALKLTTVRNTSDVSAPTTMMITTAASSTTGATMRTGSGVRCPRWERRRWRRAVVTPPRRSLVRRCPASGRGGSRRGGGQPSSTMRPGRCARADRGTTWRRSRRGREPRRDRTRRTRPPTPGRQGRGGADDLRHAPTSTPRVGSSTRSTSGEALSHLPSATFC